jgi:hypothetical protein
MSPSVTACRHSLRAQGKPVRLWGLENSAFQLTYSLLVSRFKAQMLPKEVNAVS